MRDCTACHLRAGCTQVVHGIGPGDAAIALVGEAPGAEEDASGRPFVGRAGGVLDECLNEVGIDRERIFISNVFHCRPPGNDISAAEGSPCPHLWLAAELRSLTQLRVVVALGRTALSHFRPGSTSELVRTLAARDTRWPDPQKGPLWIVGSYHPSSALRGNVAARESIVSALRRATLYAPRDTWQHETT